MRKRFLINRGIRLVTQTCLPCRDPGRSFRGGAGRAREWGRGEAIERGSGLFPHTPFLFPISKLLQIFPQIYMRKIWRISQVNFRNNQVLIGSFS